MGSLPRFENRIAKVSISVPRPAIGQAVDRIVHIRRTPEGRRVETVLAVDGVDGDGYRLLTLAEAATSREVVRGAKSNNHGSP